MYHSARDSAIVRGETLAQALKVRMRIHQARPNSTAHSPLPLTYYFYANYTLLTIHACINFGYAGRAP